MIKGAGTEVVPRPRQIAAVSRLPPQQLDLKMMSTRTIWHSSTIHLISRRTARIYLWGDLGDDAGSVALVQKLPLGFGDPSVAPGHYEHILCL